MKTVIAYLLFCSAAWAQNCPGQPSYNDCFYWSWQSLVAYHENCDTYIYASGGLLARPWPFLRRYYGVYEVHRDGKWDEISGRQHDFWWTRPDGRPQVWCHPHYPYSLLMHNIDRANWEQILPDPIYRDYPIRVRVYMVCECTLPDSTVLVETSHIGIPREVDFGTSTTNAGRICD